MRFGRRRRRTAKEPDVAIDDPRLAGWETVSTFEAVSYTHLTLPTTPYV